MRKITAATTPVCGDVSSSRSGSRPLRQSRRSTERGEVIPSDRTRTLHGRRKRGRQRPGNPRCERSQRPPVQAKGKTDSKVNTTTKKPVIDNWGDSAGFHAARQDAQLPRLTVHWLSVTRATEGPRSEISDPYFSLDPAAIDIGHVDSLDGPLVSI